MKLSQLITEAPRKKVVEPSWADDKESGYAELRDIQKSLSWRPFRGDFQPQLFVPKKRHPDDVRANEVRARLRQVAKELEAEKAKLKEEAPPILTAFNEAPPGYNKPQEGFWTSSAINNGGTWTSDWFNFVKINFPRWQTDYGYLFQVNNNARVFDLSYADRYFEWAFKTGQVKVPDDEYYIRHGWPTEAAMRIKFPWDLLARHFDGAHHSGYNSDDFTQGWDVESTVWFNTGVLKYRGAVKLTQSEDEE